jgi:two-component system phosphate regulon response regulator PhoB
MSRAANVLMVQDEIEQAGSVAFDLREAGYDVVTATRGHDALHLAASYPPDLVVVDQRLPDISGLDVCRRIKEDPKTALISVIIVGQPSGDSERLAGLELGADDFVTKPVSDREIVLRAHAVLRRRYLHSVKPRQEPVRAGPVVLDPDAHRAQIEGEDVDLTLLEFKLLWTLASRKGTVLPRQTLLSDVWGPEINVEVRTVDQHVKRLRAKLGSARALIHTVRGIGYRFELSL